MLCAVHLAQANNQSVMCGSSGTGALCKKTSGAEKRMDATEDKRMDQVWFRELENDKCHTLVFQPSRELTAVVVNNTQQRMVYKINITAI